MFISRTPSNYVKLFLCINLLEVRGEIKYIAEFVDRIKTVHSTTNLFKTLLDTVFCHSNTFFILGYPFPMVLKMQCYILFFGTPDLDLLQGHTGQCESYWVIFDPRWKDLVIRNQIRPKNWLIIDFKASLPHQKTN